MMQIKIISDEQKGDWDRFVEASPDVISWHKYDWYKVLKKYYGLPYYPIAAYEGDEIRGILPLYGVNTRRTGATLISVPYFVAGGIVAPEEETRNLIFEHAINLAKEKGASLTLKQYRTKIEGNLTTDATYFNRELALTEDIDAIWNSITPENRAKIEEAKNYNLRLDYPSTDFSTFYKLFAANQHDQGVPYSSKKWVRYLVDTKMYVMAIVWKEGEPVACTFAKKFKDTVSLPFTSLSPRHKDKEVFVYHLYWELLKSLAADGIHIMHSGRIPDSEEVPQYRLGWGGEKHRYYYQYSGKSQGGTESTSKRGRKRELFTTVWRKLPQPVTQFISPYIVKQFP